MPQPLSIAGVPLLLRAPPGGGPAPLIVLWHGYGQPGSERELAEALPLEGVHAYRAYLGLPLFGERLPPGGVEALTRLQRTDYVLGMFMPMAMGAIAELPEVVAGLERMGARTEGGIGLFGFSGGAGTALTALAEGGVRFAAAVTLNAPRNLAAGVAGLERLYGVPYPWDAESRAAARRADPAGRAAEIAHGEPPPAVLLLNGEEDEFVPPDEGAVLYDALRPHYERAGRLDRLERRVLPGVSHHVGPVPRREGRPRISSSAPVDAAAAEWFRRWLAADDDGSAAPRPAASAVAG